MFWLLRGIDRAECPARLGGRLRGAPIKKSTEHDVWRDVARDVPVATIPKREVQREVEHEPPVMPV